LPPTNTPTANPPTLFPTRRSSDLERRHEPMRLAALDASDQVDPRGDVAPLIAAAHLDRALFAAKQVQEVVRLEQHVAEFGVRDRWEEQTSELQSRFDLV